MSKTVMMFGVGDLGGWVLEFLARREGVSTIIVCDKREDWGVMKVNCAAAGAGQEGYSKRMLFEKCDVSDIAATAGLINKYSPDVIYSGLTLMGWAARRAIGTKITGKFAANVLVLPLQATLNAKLMKAVKESGITVPVVNNSYPDIVNPVLWKSGLPVLMGAGNLDNIVGEVRRKISVAEDVPIREVTVYLIAEHALNVLGSRSGVPFFFKVMVRDRNITDKVNVDSLISDRLLVSPIDQTTWLSHPAIASSAVRNVMAIINDTNEFAHAAGPNGLPGGYPVRISAKGVEIVLPEEVSMEEAIKINTEGMKKEGIEEIKDDGTVILTDEASILSQKLYGTALREIKVADLASLGKEMLAACKRIVEEAK